VLPNSPSSLSTEPLELAANEIHVWLGGSDCIEDLGVSPSRQSMLTSAERDLCARLVFPEDGAMKRAARVLLRTVLSRYAPVSPESWQFESSPLGKPRIQSEAEIPPLRFNVSHTRGLIAVAVNLHHELGVDVESLERQLGKPLLRSALADSEWHQLMRLAETDRTRRFCEFWTLKEAYLKARGVGLQDSLQDFAFLLETDRPPRILFSQALHQTTEEWQFWQLGPFPSHVAALAVHRPDRCQMIVRTFHVGKTNT
jgi:4'-phosphopantetheinyl transferase